MSYPRIEVRQNRKILLVHDKPFVMLAGEVHNSNASSPAYMEQVWQQADRLGMNSLLLPIGWEMVEPEEGKFDFSLVDALLEQARRYGKKIGLLWFGAWKNAQCYYAPAWVKTRPDRFRRAEIIKGQTNVKGSHGMAYTSLSAFCPETMQADAKAFAHLMNHLRQVDGNENTVICVQVENETGVLGSGRERSNEADRLFAAPVPESLTAWLRMHPEELSDALRAAFCPEAAPGSSWETVFGSMAEEVFTSYYTASYVNAVAQAGKDAYPLPMVVNCWLDKGQVPGKYPSGGPVAKVMAIWHYAAPVIDVIAPDIYIPVFCDVCDQYHQHGNPLFIAECATHSYAGVRELYAVGHYHALCYSPFGFEEMGEPFTVMQGFLFGMDTEDEALKTPQDPAEYRKINDLLQQLMPRLCEAYGTDDLQAAISERSAENLLSFGAYQFRANFSSPFIRRKNGACLVLRTAEDEFYAILCGVSLEALSADPEAPHVDYLLVEEGELEESAWKPGRRLNGDEVAIMLFEEPKLVKIRVFRYQ